MVVYETIDLRYHYAMVIDEKEHIVPILDQTLLQIILILLQLLPETSCVKQQIWRSPSRAWREGRLCPVCRVGMPRAWPEQDWNKHIEAWTKWPPVSRRLQMGLSDRKHLCCFQKVHNKSDDNKSALVQVMVWRRIDAKPFRELIVSWVDDQFI